MFDLEKAISAWRHACRRQRFLLDEDIFELERHIRDLVSDLTHRGWTDQEAFLQAIKEVGDFTDAEREYRLVYWGKLKRKHLRLYESNCKLAMLKSYLFITLRNIRKHKSFSFINVFGLAVGLACCAVIILYVTNELTYDTYHPEADRIYRVGVHRENSVGVARQATTPGPLGPVLENDFPQIEFAVRVVPPFENADNVLVQRNEIRFFENRIYFVDPNIVEVFRIPFLQGDARTALTRPGTVVLTRQMAIKYFGGENVLGQHLEMEFHYDRLPVEMQTFEVTGIIENAPANTHLKYNMLVSMATFRSNVPSFEEDWVNPHYKFTYVKLAEGVDAGVVEEQIQPVTQLAKNGYEEFTGRMYGFYDLLLQPVSDIHMHPLRYGEIEPPGNWYYLYIYSIVALLILLIGSTSFMNLSAALSTTRTKEVGLRKVVGAHRRQLVLQFLGESFLITAMSFIGGFLLMALLLPFFNGMAGTALSLAGLYQPIVLLSIIVLLLVVGLGAGAYPAFILTAFRPVSVIKGLLAPTARGSYMQKALVISQFSISILLIVCTVTVYRQLGFMKSRALGFDREQKLVLHVKSELEFLRRNVESVKEAFTQHPEITGATVSSGVPGRQSGGYYMTVQDVPEAEQTRLLVFTVDYDFISELGIEMVAGRPLLREREDDEANAYVINEAGARALGFSTPDEALGHEVFAHYHGMTKTVVGVTSDFHYRGMQDIVQPMVLDIENSLFDTITLSINTTAIEQTMDFVEQKWSELFPGVPIEYSFLDEIFDHEYRYEEQAGRLLSIITLLGLAVACLGLLGMGSFLAQRRKKEIGIRKVLGASVSRIVSLLSKQFIFLILASGLIATPIAWLAMNRWLQDFAYHIEVGYLIFVLAIGGALLIALASVSFQGIRAAHAEPVDSLRSE